jgi:hypothetical protein
MSEQGHTPLPWRINKKDGTIVRGEGSDWDSVKLHSDWIEGAWEGDDEAIANNAMIVRAVNSHKALVDALRGLLTYDRVERPAMRTHPHGAPGSTVRIATDKLIALEDAALAALKLAGEA